MKKKILMLTAMTALLASCGKISTAPASSSTGGGDTTPESSDTGSQEHIHNFNLKVIDDKYLVEAANCEHGAIYYYSCECGEAGTETFTYGTAHHELTKHDAAESTCKEHGNSEYYQCSVCGKYFSDANGANEIEEGSWTLPLTDHVYGDYVLDESSSYPNFVFSSTCDVCGDSLTKEIYGYDFTQYDFGMEMTLLNSDYTKSETTVDLTVDEVEKGLVAPLQGYTSNETFVTELPKIDYTSFGQIEYDFKVYNVVNRTGGDAGFVCFGINAEHPEWLISTANLVYPTVKLIIKNDNGTVTASLTGSFDGNSQTITLSEDQATGAEAFKLFTKVSDGYRNVVIMNPIVRTKYEYSDTEDYGCAVERHGSDGTGGVDCPIYCTNNYVEGQPKLRFDLSDRSYETSETSMLYMPAFDFSTYDAFYFPMHWECANQSAGNTYFQLSFDNETYFISDTAENSTGYLSFVRNGESFEVSYIYNGQVVATTSCSDEDVINGRDNFMMYFKVSVNWRRFSIGMPTEGEVKLSYDFSKSAYGSKVYWDGGEVLPQQTTGFGPSEYKLRFDLSDTDAHNQDYFCLDLPMIKYSDFDEFYLPFYLEAGCQSADSSNLIFSFDNDNYFNADTAEGQTNYLAFVRNGSSYNVSYLLNGESVATMVLSDSQIIGGKKCLTMYGCAGVNWRRFSILAPQYSRPSEFPISVTGNNNSWWQGQGYATFFAYDAKNYPTGEYRSVNGCVLTVTRGGTVYNCVPSFGRSPVNHDSGDTNMWFIQSLSNWHMCPETTGLTGFEDGDVITVSGTYESATDSNYKITFNFSMTWSLSGGTIIQ